MFQDRRCFGMLCCLLYVFLNVAFVFIILLLIIVLVDKINFPYPNKKIEKIISNENFKIVK